MTRKKKSRKPSAAPVRLSKQEKQKLAELKDKKPKKKTGQKPGNRQQAGRAQQATTEQQAQNKDPRLGSKKPIVLGDAPNVALAPKAKPKKSSAPKVAPIRVVDDQSDLREALEAIEQDERLQDILAKQEQDLELTSNEVDYFNELMDKHQQISETLGLSDEDDDEEESTAKKAKDDDDLWDSLDNQDFSDYQ